MRRLVGFLLPATAVFLGSVADAPRLATEPKKDWVIFSGDEIVEGNRATPTDGPIVLVKPAKQPSLIEVRINFVPEILRSAEDI